jgi:hypothetical protein
MRLFSGMQRPHFDSEFHVAGEQAVENLLTELLTDSRPPITKSIDQIHDLIL